MRGWPHHSHTTNAHLKGAPTVAINATTVEIVAAARTEVREIALIRTTSAVRRRSR